MTKSKIVTCSLEGASVRKWADDQLLVVDWAYYKDSQKNCFRANVAPDNGCMSYPNGQVPQLTNQRKARALEIQNRGCQSLCFLDLPLNAFGKSIEQCDQIIYPSETEPKQWVLLVELKYSDPLRDKRQREKYASNIQKKYNKAVAQILDTEKHIRSCSSCKKRFPKLTYAVVSFPRIQGIAGQAQTIRKLTNKKLLSKLGKRRLPQVANKLNIENISKYKL